MKRVFYLVALVATLLMSACTTTPADYLDSVTTEVKKISDAEKVLANSLDSTQVSDAKKAINKSYKKLQRMQAFRGNDSLRTAALEYGKFFNDLYNSDNNRLIYLLQKSAAGDTLTDEEKAEHDMLFQNYLNGSNILNIRVTNAQIQFLKSYDLIRDFN